jgi:hypothetical protein
MKYADWEHLTTKKDREFDKAIAVCEQHWLHDPMGFQYD